MSGKKYEGKLIVEGQRVAIIISRFNEFFTSKLLGGAHDCLIRHGARPEDIDDYWVPGAFEIPLLASKLAAKTENKYDGIICLGALIRGATPHFDYISAEATKGVATAAMQSGLPVAYGIITVDTLEQAIERAGTKAGNKGAEAALSVIEMMNLYRQI